ncbi:MAG: hypothetical protein EBW24_05130, partial [Actinobacteria bacterium]|nr:hypothetical protein [Actinomycetota bacterium]
VGSVRCVIRDRHGAHHDAHTLITETRLGSKVISPEVKVGPEILGAVFRSGLSKKSETPLPDTNAFSL